MLPWNSRARNRQNLNGDRNPAQELFVNPSKPHFWVKKKTQACIGWLWQRKNKFAFPNLLTCLSGYHEWMYCICQYSTQWQLKVENHLKRNYKLFGCTQGALFGLPGQGIALLSKMRLSSKADCWLWLWVGAVWGETGHSSTQWTPPAVSNALDLCRSWEVSALNGYFYFKSLNKYFQPICFNSSVEFSLCTAWLEARTCSTKDRS